MKGNKREKFIAAFIVMLLITTGFVPSVVNAGENKGVLYYQKDGSTYEYKDCTWEYGETFHVYEQLYLKESSASSEASEVTVNSVSAADSSVLKIFDVSKTTLKEQLAAGKCPFCNSEAEITPIAGSGETWYAINCSSDNCESKMKSDWSESELNKIMSTASSGRWLISAVKNGKTKVTINYTNENNVKGAYTYTVTVPLYHKVTFAAKYDDGSTYTSVQYVADGTAAPEPENVPAKAGYTLAGWDADFSCVTADLTVNAVWKDAYGTLCFDGDMVRIYGSNRYLTASAVADTLKMSLGVDSKFENIIVASGADYPDALAGSYLAKVKNAPVMLVGKDTKSEADVKQYISKNLKAGGTVYLLGGTGAVTSRFEKSLGNLKVERLGGQTRYDTNIAILKAAGVNDEDLLVCTGEGFADSLSASAVGKPILLVAKAGLNSTQKSYLSSIDVNDVYIIGGTGVVSINTAKQMNDYDQYGTCERVCGSNRYQTSVAVAKQFFPLDADTAVLAYAHNFPDGLSGGPLALSADAPLLLVDSSASGYSDAAAYAEDESINKVIVLGGKTLITDSAVKNIIQ